MDTKNKFKEDRLKISERDSFSLFLFISQLTKKRFQMLYILYKNLIFLKKIKLI